MKRLILLLAVCVFAGQALAAARIKDITSLRGARDSQLIGYGLVVGLQGTGDTLRNVPFTEQSIQSMLDHMGLNVRGNQLRNRNVAAVIVTADLPAGMAAGSRLDVTVKAVGDLHVDHHHTTEDVGIALGQAVKQALGTMAGITRYASIHMPMDETLSRVVIDISGRPVLVFKVDFPRDKVGNFDTELVREWFNAFAINAGVTLHVETLYGENSHHIAESCFKGLARALRAAVAIDPRAAGEVPSTKGQLGG